MIILQQIKRTDPRILDNMKNHYSAPKGFVGRNICYAILYNDIYYGSIVGGSATLHLPNRNEYFGINKSHLNHIINNIFFHVEKVNNKYPCHSFLPKILQKFRETMIKDWELKYNDKVLGFETLVELPRTGECYRRDGWKLIGQTAGYTCKRTAGKGTDSWSGKRVWDTNNLKPKLVFAKLV